MKVKSEPVHDAAWLFDGGLHEVPQGLYSPLRQLADDLKLVPREIDTSQPSSYAPVNPEILSRTAAVVDAARFWGEELQLGGKGGLQVQSIPDGYTQEGWEQYIATSNGLAGLAQRAPSMEWMATLSENLRLLASRLHGSQMEGDRGEE